jgi:hypothetical protein
MRVPMAGFGFMMAAAGILAGCEVPKSESRRVVSVQEGDIQTTRDVPKSYLIACRAIVIELREALGDACVIHEVWPDIEQAGVRVSAPTRGGRVLLVTISARGPDRCHVEIFVDRYWKGRTYPAICAALGEPAP